jgi:hemoglobin/transferrin/lactoferrin receptor protein
MKTPASVSVIDLDTFKRNGVSNAGDVVRYQSGISNPFEFSGADSYVSYKRGGFTNYRIRGVEGNRVLLNIDGIRQPAQVEGAGGNGRDYFDTGIFQRVEILKGSGSSLYGSDAMGGAVTFQTRSVEDELIDAERPWIVNTRLEYKDVNEGFGSIIGTGVRLGPWYISLNNAARRKSETKNDKGKAEANPQNSKNNHLLAKISYIPQDTSKLSFTVENFRRRQQTELNTIKGHEPAGVNNIKDVFFARNESNDERTRFSLDYNEERNSSLCDSLETKLYYQSTKTHSVTDEKSDLVNLTNGEKTPSRDRTDDILFERDIYGFTAEASRKLETKKTLNTLSYGVEISEETAKNDFIRTERAKVFDFNPPSIAYDEVELKRYDCFLQNITEWDKWLLQVGIRAGYYELLPENSPEFLSQKNAPPASPDYDNLTLSPSLSVQYEINPEMVIWGRYAQGIRNPGVEDYVGYFSHPITGGEFIQIPNPDLKEESSHSFDLGIKFASQYTEIEATAHYTTYKNFIEMDEVGKDGDTVIQQSVNMGDVNIYGFDFRLDYELQDLSEGLKGFSTGLQCSYAKGDNKTTDDNVNTTAPFDAIIHFGYDSANMTNPWGTRLYATYRAEKTDTTSGYPYFIPPSSFVLDLTGYWMISDRVRIDAGIRNLTDERYWLWSSSNSAYHIQNSNPEEYAQPGINGFISVSFQL